MTDKTPKPKAEWKDDIQVLPADEGEREHDLVRSCWCEPRLVGLPTSVDGNPDPVKRVHVRHRIQPDKETPTS